MVQQPLPEAPDRPVPARMDRVWAWFERSGRFQGAVSFYRRHERYAPALFFFGGVAWDAATLRRIDAWFDNVFLFAYIVGLGALIAVTALVESDRLHRPWVLRYRRWLPAAIQFFLGALFSAYVIYYSQSASLTTTSMYLLVLVGLLIANEFIHRRSVNLYLLFALYFLAVASFFIFLVPTLIQRISYGSFLLGSVLSVFLVGGIVGFLHGRGVFESSRQFQGMLGVVLGLFGLLNLFYLQDWIPPVPLALRHGGIYHRVERRPDTHVRELYFERPPWYQFWVDSDETFHYAEGDTAYCFVAVFAPTELKTRIYHVWRYYDERQRAWVTTDRRSYALEGGRSRGWRGETYKRNLRPGRWRVDVQTEGRRTLGRIPFTVAPVEDKVSDLKRIVYD